MAKLPAYELIRRDIAEQIAGGIYVPPTRIPSESRLAEQYGVTRMTVRQAVTELVREGLLIRRQGLGTYVAEAASRSCAHPASLIRRRGRDRRGRRRHRDGCPTGRTAGRRTLRRRSARAATQW